MDLSNMNVIRPMDPDEIADMNREITRQNEHKARIRQAAANRSAGIAQPRPGDVLYVTPARGIRARSRAGIRFFDERRTPVIVVEVEPDAAEKTKLNTEGKAWATVDGAEEILGDSSLVTFQSPASEIDAMELRSENQRQAEEIARLKAENARILREARQSAPESKSGEPSRLRAAAAAKGKLAKDDDFGNG